MSAYQDERFAITYRYNRAPLTLICRALYGPQLELMMFHLCGGQWQVELQQGLPYHITWRDVCRADTGKAYVLLRQQANSNDVLRSAFHAHLLLHQLDADRHAPHDDVLLVSPDGKCSPTEAADHASQQASSAAGRPCVDRGKLQSIRREADIECAAFLRRCQDSGWDLKQTMLNPRESRLVDYAL